MLTFRRLGSFVFAEPFRPFRIRMVNGQTVDIRYQDMVRLSGTSAYIDHFWDDETPEPETVCEIPLKMIESVELLDNRPQWPAPVITAKQVASYLKAQPFRPFRLHMASGQTFDIRHPEMLKMGKGFLLLFSFDSDDAELVERWDSVSLMLIESISHIDQPVSN